MYINWTGIPGSVCDKKKYNQHLHIYMNKAHSIASQGSEWGLGKSRLIVRYSSSSNSRNQRYCPFYSEKRNFKKRKMRSMCCLTARNIIFVGKIILNFVWVLTRTSRIISSLIFRKLLLSSYGISE